MSSKEIDLSKDFYGVFGLSFGASSEDIKKAYRELALRLHPDKNKDDPEAQKKFMNMQESFEALTDPETKKMIDDSIKGKNEKANMLERMERKRKQRELDEFEKERAAKFRECLYYCPVEKNFRTSLGPTKVPISIFSSVAAMRDFAASTEAKEAA